MGYNSKYTGAQIDALLDKINEGKTSTPRVAMTASSAELAPDTFYVWGMADSLDLTLADGDAGVMNKYLFQFRNPKDSVTMLTLPDDITWSEDTELDENGMPVMEATAFYRIEIIEGLASLKKWKLAYIVFADAEVERVLMANGVGDGIGITKAQLQNLSSIGEWFRGNTVVDSFPELAMTSVNTIGQKAFQESSIRELILPEALQSIASDAFYNCDSLQSIHIPNHCLTIGANAFAYCDNLQIIEVGESVETIGDRAFSYNPLLQDFLIRATTPPSIGVNVFASSKCKLYVPDGSIGAYQSATNWSEVKERMHPISEYGMPIVPEGYIQDSLVMCLDGIKRGHVAGQWVDLVGGNHYTNYGAIELDNGYEFDGATYLKCESSNAVSFEPVISATGEQRTMEIVVEFYGNTATEMCFNMGYSGLAFGRTSSLYIASGSAYNLAVRQSHALGSHICLFACVGGTPAQFFENGVELTDTAKEYCIADWYIGKAKNGREMKGKIHAIRIHGRALTEEEILHNQRLDNERFDLGLTI